MTHAPVSRRQDQNGVEEVEKQRPSHPDIDGGWGWWVVFASFCIHIVSKYSCFFRQKKCVKTKITFKKKPQKTSLSSELSLSVRLSVKFLITRAIFFYHKFTNETCVKIRV